MYSIEETQEMLQEAAEQIPADLYEGLNGGIALLPEIKYSKHSRPGRPLYIMGEYHRDKSLGRYIVIYYGSFNRVFGHLSRKAYSARLFKTLRHEFRHHIEGKAGSHDLEIEDAYHIRSYLSGMPEEKRGKRRFKIRPQEDASHANPAPTDKSVPDHEPGPQRLQR